MVCIYYVNINAFVMNRLSKLFGKSRLNLLEYLHHILSKDLLIEVEWNQQDAYILENLYRTLHALNMLEFSILGCKDLFDGKWSEIFRGF